MLQCKAVDSGDSIPACLGSVKLLHYSLFQDSTNFSIFYRPTLVRGDIAVDFLKKTFKFQKKSKLQRKIMFHKLT